MARCDLCGASCDAHMLETLPEQEQTSTVRDVCPKCQRWVTAVRKAIVAQNPGQIRDQIAARASKPPTLRWWQRLVQKTVEAEQ